jgi:hypothetical protein
VLGDLWFVVQPKKNWSGDRPIKDTLCWPNLQIFKSQQDAATAMTDTTKHPNRSHFHTRHDLECPSPSVGDGIWSYCHKENECNTLFNDGFVSREEEWSWALAVASSHAFRPDLAMFTGNVGTEIVITRNNGGEWWLAPSVIGMTGILGSDFVVMAASNN